MTYSIYMGFITKSRNQGECEALHKMHEKYPERVNQTKFFRSYDTKAGK